MSEASESRPQIRVRGRSLMAIVLTPEPPLANWLAALDAQIKAAPSFFDQQAVIVELTALPSETPDIAGFLDELEARGIRIIGTEGAHPSWSGIKTWLRPLANTRASSKPVAIHASFPAAQPAQEPSALVIDRPVRSGQSVVFEHGDLTVVGSVSSGAEIVATGSIHVYGALRGRALAGLKGNSRARIFCRRLEAEFLAIDGLYHTADEMDPGLRGRAVQAWLDGKSLMIAALD
ncbi:MAG: septum site-determining protein MinC, partial [Acetobacteraceae bacterium]